MISQHIVHKHSLLRYLPYRVSMWLSAMRCAAFGTGAIHSIHDYDVRPLPGLLGNAKIDHVVLQCSWNVLSDLPPFDAKSRILRQQAPNQGIGDGLKSVLDVPQR